MKGWLIVNGFLKNEKFNEISNMFIESSKELQIELEIIENNQLLVGSSSKNSLINLNSAKNKPDFVIFWDKDIFLAQYLQKKGLKVFNNYETIRICDDKRETFLYLENNNIPSPKTIIMPMTYDNIGINNLDFFDDVEKELSYPIIIKEAFGSFGQQVYKADNKEEARELLKKIKSNKLLFQEFIENSKGKDVRLQVVGEKVVAAMLRHSENDFRSNITAGGRMESYKASKEEEKLAIDAAKAVGADFAGIDILFGKDGPLVCEINSNAHFKKLYDCTKVDTSKEILKYIIKKTFSCTNDRIKA